MIWHLIATMLFALPSIRGECQIFSLTKLEQCRATINCTVSLTDESSTLNSWDCIRRRNNNYDYYYRRRNEEYTTDTNYELYIQLQNADINIFADPLSGLNNLLIANIKTLSVIEGNLVSVAPKVYELNSLRELVIIKNMIEKIDLTQLSYISTLKILNVSQNAISLIDDGDQRLERSKEASNVHTIDLSHNELESIPDNCFLRFSHLLYLDLSHNLLDKIDILTFEGMGHIETLLLSHNQLKEMSLNFVRFTHMKILKLDHNDLTSLREMNLKTLINLEQFDVSSNQLQTVEEKSFSVLLKLQKIDLSGNQIKTISGLFFKNNINLHSLYISNNYIDNIEDGVFEGKNITDFSITGNNIAGTIGYSTFRGIHVDMLDLSDGKITTITDKAFSDMGSELRCLNLSRNIIETMSKTCFENLTALSKLDLSNNKLVDLDFNSEDLKELTEFYLQKNNIKKIGASMLKNLKSLLTFDVSQNALEGFEENSFSGLNKLETLVLSNNDLHSLGPNMFTGLEKLKRLELFQTKIVSLDSTLFGGLFSLEILNISHSQLETIDYKAFDGTGRIKILDVSFNFLESFSDATDNFFHLKELYLNNNKLKNISELTFSNMSSLEKINLAQNELMHFHSRALRNLNHLNYLNLTSNINLKLESDTFNNLKLSELSLDNIQKPFNFDLAKDASITTLTLSNCNISNVDSVSVYNIENLSKLTLRSNLLTSLSKESFKKMPLLNSLDLSQNRISFIQPGTFLHTDMINTLCLNENNLQTLQFGALDGLSNLRTLNLSNNEIRELNPYLLRSLHHLSIIYVENNDIVKIDFGQFSKTSITTLYIGQNPIACEQLTNMNKTINGKLNITATHFDFNTENVDGIPCVTYFTSRKYKINESNNNATNDLSELKVTVNLLQEIFSKNLNETISISRTLKDIISDISKYENEMTVEFNESQSSIVKYLQELLNKHDFLRTAMINSNHDVIESLKSVLLEFNNKLINASTDLLLGQNEAMLNLYNKEKQGPSTHMQPNEESRNDSYDIKLLLYVIAACLAIQTLVTVLLLLYKCFFKNKRTVPFNNGENDSIQPLNVMEIKL